MDTLTPEQRRKNMQAIRSNNTQIELSLANALYIKGLRYRKNNKTVFGKPDFTFKKYKIAIFCDSEFWHGKNWKRTKKNIKSNKKYWHKKIERNIQRDKQVNKELRKQGWKVIRFWEKQIKNNPEKCAMKIFLLLDPHA
jgi:DNA mismatch endonuclease Vsr